MCCVEGKVSLPPFKQTPSPLAELMDYRGGKKSRIFRENIRVYNSMFQFTSIVGGKIDERINKSPGPYVFRVGGQNHHKLGSLLPMDGQKPKFAQLYIYDTENEVHNRMQSFGCLQNDSNADEDVVRELTVMFDKTNVIVKAFRMAREQFKELDYLPMRLRLIDERLDKQYSNPTCPEVAALIVGDFQESINNRDIVVDYRSSGLQRINDLHPAFMPMQYPLLFPYGEDGFHLGIPYVCSHKRKTKRSSITAREFYAYVLQQRPSDGLTLIKGGKLFHQYVVDAFTSIERMRLEYIKRKQKKMRYDVFQGIVDALSKGDTDANVIGKQLILPACFTAGPRYIMQNYQDAMAICRYFGYPDLFITFTCSAKWPEINEALKSIAGQKAHDRPDIIVRVFKIRLLIFMDDLVKHKHFGHAVAGQFLLCILLYFTFCFCFTIKSINYFMVILIYCSSLRFQSAFFIFISIFSSFFSLLLLNR